METLKFKSEKLVGRTNEKLGNKKKAEEIREEMGKL